MVYNLLIIIEKSDFVTFYCYVSCILKSVFMVVISNFCSIRLFPTIFVSVTFNMTKKSLKSWPRKICLSLLYRTGYLLAFFIKIEPSPNTNGRQDGVLGMKLAKDFKVVCGLATVD